VPDSWLPAAPKAGRRADWQPWRPAEVPDVAGLAYVVVDELEAAVAGLVVSEWPLVDHRGRLRFDPERDRHLAVDARRLAALLSQRRVAALPELRERPPAIGDVFAARVALHEDVDEPADPSEWFEGEVFDLSGPAREAAKVQTSAALAGVLTPKDVEVLADEFMEP
jgi:hypothetical protein